MVVDVRLKHIDFKDLSLESVPHLTRIAFSETTKLKFLEKHDWYLAGGTALALQTGHRESVDLNFFTTESDFNRTSIEKFLLTTKHWQTSFQERGTLYGILSDAKMSLIAYPFFKPSGDFLHCGMVRILKPHDIAVMKIVAMSQRGRKRDFIDLYWYFNFYEPALERGIDPIKDTLSRTLEQYPSQSANLPHFLKSLTYFDDAEEDPMPTCHFKITWPQIKKYFQREMPRVVKELLT